MLYFDLGTFRIRDNRGRVISSDVNGTVHGPTLASELFTINFSFLGQSSFNYSQWNLAKDRLLCIHCDFWPNEASEWLT